MGEARRLLHAVLCVVCSVSRHAMLSVVCCVSRHAMLSVVCCVPRHVMLFAMCSMPPCLVCVSGVCRFYFELSFKQSIKQAVLVHICVIIICHFMLILSLYEFIII